MGRHSVTGMSRLRKSVSIRLLEPKGTLSYADTYKHTWDSILAAYLTAGLVVQAAMTLV